jgi:hypothetical protein
MQVVVVLVVIAVSLLLLAQVAHCALYASFNYAKSYNYYYLWVPAKVDGKYLLMMLDTGAWMSFITNTDVHRLGLDMLPQSKLVGTGQTVYAGNGEKRILKAVDVTMSLDGSHPFNTTVATAIGSWKLDVSLVSLHDFLKVYHGIDFKSCRFVHTFNGTTLSTCHQ